MSFLRHRPLLGRQAVRVLVLVGSGWAQTVAAQSPSDPTLVEAEAESARNTLQSVIVTADRRETNLQSTPIAISAFGPSQLQERAVGSVRDLAGQVPNLSIARANISYTTQTYSLRGVGETDPIQEPVLAVYVDDVYQTRQLGAMMDFNDIERIEVLRGPQGTLYGRNSSAGALRVLSKDPGNEFRTNDSLTYGRFNQVKALASVSGALVKDKLFASLSFLHNRRDGFVWDPTLHRDVNRINVDAARIKLRWTPTHKWDVLTTFNGMLDRSDTRSYVPNNQPGEFSKRRSYSEVPPYQNLNQGGAALRIVHKVDPHLELKSITSTTGFNLKPVWYDNDGEAALIQKNLIHYADNSYVDPAYPGSSVRGNAGKAHTAGAEIETDARLPYGFSLAFAGGYLKAIYDDYKNAGGMGVNADGHPLVNAPKWNLTSSAGYDILLPVPGFVKLAADVQWASPYNSNALARPEDKNPAQAFVNGTLSWTSPDEHVSAWLSGRNLGDSQKTVSSTYTPGTGVRYFNYPDPRTVMFTLRYQR
ncbi:MAG: hypothetical protein RLZZ450_3592 [Pseudomonadota bacterium]